MQKYCEFIQVYKIGNDTKTYQTSKLPMFFLDNHISNTEKFKMTTIAIFKIKCNDKKL
jgi:hypothetical protein